MKTKEELNALKEEIEALNKKLSELSEDELKQVVGGTSTGNDSYVWPVPGFHNILCAFNDDTSQGLYNKGITISGNGIDGASVVAAADGTVNPIYFCNGGYGGGYGIFCQIDHENGKATRYAHLKNILVSPGQSVFRGQVIGYVGMTGDVASPCLQFETKRFGVNYDPMSEF